MSIVHVLIIWSFVSNRDPSDSLNHVVHVFRSPLYCVFD